MTLKFEICQKYAALIFLACSATTIDHQSNTMDFKLFLNFQNVSFFSSWTGSLKKYYLYVIFVPFSKAQYFTSV